MGEANKGTAFDTNPLLFSGFDDLSFLQHKTFI
jgi:hypothetical protein